MEIGHYEFWAEFFADFSIHLDHNYKKKNKAIWIKGKNNKNHRSWQKNQCPGKKKWKGSVLVVLARNLIYNWFLFYTNLRSEISIEN